MTSTDVVTFPSPPPRDPISYSIVIPHPFQLSEKLDAVRERAGTVLQSLVQSRDPQLPFIPQRGALTHAIAGVGEMGAGESVNWASPAATFPIVVGLLAVPEYHDAIGTRRTSPVQDAVVVDVVDRSATLNLPWAM